MNLITLVPEILRQLPAPVRSALYTAILVIGAGLAACTALGVEDLGPVTLARALEAYAFVSPLAGGVAVANVGQSSTPGQLLAAEGGGVEDEWGDLSSFEPVPEAATVFGPTT